MRYRSNIEIIGQILAAANGGGATKTRIMYKVFLNSGQSKEFLTTLIERGLLRFDRETQKFKITEKGLKLLHACTELSEFMKGIAQSKVTRYIESQIY
jgi:predicted transcriptional regulator